MKINATEIRVGMILEYKNDLWEVLKTQHVKPGKGGAFAQVEMKSLNKNTKLNERFRSSESVEKASLEETKFNFLYKDGDDYYFMDNETYEQLNVESDSVGDGKFFLTAGLNVDLLFDGNEVLDVRLPSHVILEVTDTEPGFKGNTATGATKPAKVETGLTLNVPLFINEGEKLRIDTRTGEYVERSKE